MRFLLDTHALLWWLFDDERLSAPARAAIADPGNELLVSPASAWEIGTKFRIGKLPSAEPLVRDFSRWIERAGFIELPIRLEHGLRAGRQVHDHRDPFDRMLAAQGFLEQVPVITCDPVIRSLGASTYW